MKKIIFALTAVIGLAGAGMASAHPPRYVRHEVCRPVVVETCRPVCRPVIVETCRPVCPPVVVETCRPVVCAPRIVYTHGYRHCR